MIAYSYHQSGFDTCFIKLESGPWLFAYRSLFSFRLLRSETDQDKEKILRNSVTLQEWVDAIVFLCLVIRLILEWSLLHSFLSVFSCMHFSIWDIDSFLLHRDWSLNAGWVFDSVFLNAPLYEVNSRSNPLLLLFLKEMKERVVIRVDRDISVSKYTQLPPLGKILNHYILKSLRLNWYCVSIWHQTCVQRSYSLRAITHGNPLHRSSLCVISLPFYSAFFVLAPLIKRRSKPLKLSRLKSRL